MIFKLLKFPILHPFNFSIIQFSKPPNVQASKPARASAGFAKRKQFLTLRTSIFAIPYMVFHGFSIFQQIASKTLPKLQNTSKISPKRTKLPPKYSQDAPKRLPRASQDPPKRPQELSKTPQDASSSPQDHPNDSQKHPKGLHEASKGLQEASKRLPRAPQRSPNSPVRAPRDSQMPPRAPKHQFSDSQAPSSWRAF